MLKIYYIWEVSRPPDRSRPFLTKILRDIIHEPNTTFKTVPFIVLQKICFVILPRPLTQSRPFLVSVFILTNNLHTQIFKALTVTVLQIYDIQYLLCMGGVTPTGLIPPISSITSHANKQLRCSKFQDSGYHSIDM